MAASCSGYVIQVEKASTSRSKVAVRHAQVQSLALRVCLAKSGADIERVKVSREAPVFVPAVQKVRV